MTLELFSSLAPHAPAPGADVPFSRAAPHLRPVSAADFFLLLLLLSYLISFDVRSVSVRGHRAGIYVEASTKKKDAARDKGVFMEMHGLV